MEVLCFYLLFGSLAAYTFWFAGKLPEAMSASRRMLSAVSMSAVAVMLLITGIVLLFMVDGMPRESVPRYKAACRGFMWSAAVVGIGSLVLAAAAVWDCCHGRR
jgi:hypothetical protein